MRRSGAVFYLDVNYGDNKGGVTSGQNMFSSVNGANQTQQGRQYASQRVYGEVISTTTASGSPYTLLWGPYIAGTAVISNGVETFTDNGAGVLVSSLSAGDNGTIVTTGTTTVATYAFHVTNVSGNPITANYQYFYQESVNGSSTPPASNGVPQVNINVASSVITAEDFPLRANFTLGAAIDLEKAHGLNLEDELVKYLGGEVKFTMDHLGIDLMIAASQTTATSPSAGTYGNTYAATSPGTYTATPTTGETWVWNNIKLSSE